eukprot:c28966_g2_i2 orf=867-3347(+)
MQFISCKDSCTISSNAHMMTGNKKGIGSKTADMEFRHRISDHGSSSKGCTHNKVGRMTRTGERLNPRQVSKMSNNCASSCDNGSAVLDQSVHNIAKAKQSGLYESSTNGKLHHIPGRRNVMNCFAGGFDDSGSDADVEAGTSVKKRLSGFPLSADMPFQRSRRVLCQAGCSTLSSNCFSLFSNEASVRRGNVRVPSGKSQGVRRSASYTKATVGEKPIPSSVLNARKSSSMVASLDSPQFMENSTSSVNNVGRKRFGTEFVSNFGLEKHAGEGLHVLSGEYRAAGTSQHVGGLNGDAHNSACKRGSCGQGVLGNSLRDVSHGLRFRDSNIPGTGTMAGMNRHDVGTLSCSSMTDVLTSVPSLSLDDTGDQSNCQKTVRPNILNNRSGTLQGPSSGKSLVGSSSSGSVACRNVGRSISEGSFSIRDSLAAQSARSLGPAFQADTWYSRRPLSVDSASTSSTSVGTSNQSPISGRGRRCGSPFPCSARSISRSSSSSTEQTLGPTVAFVERPSQRFIGSSGKVSSMGGSYVSRFGTVGLDFRNSIQGSVAAASSSSSKTSLILDDIEMPSSSNLSGLPPSRSPPLAPTLGSNQQYTGSIQTSQSQSSFRDNAHFLPAYSNENDSNRPFARTLSHFSRFDSSPEENYERHYSSTLETLSGRASHEPQPEFIGENRPRLMTEGLSEILTALEHVDRDEDLSYEQVLMLEATIMFGGMGLHDQFTDMRLDVDDMSYEELLALGERIGNVSTGLSEDAIGKCLKRSQYVSLNTYINYPPQEIEVKCSVCQEEFEENAELGILECGHSHHVACIKHWLLQKNLCPICKAAAFS